MISPLMFSKATGRTMQLFVPQPHDMTELCQRSVGRRTPVESHGNPSVSDADKGDALIYVRQWQV